MIQDYFQNIAGASEKQINFAADRRREWAQGAEGVLGKMAKAAGEDQKKVRILAFTLSFLSRKAEVTSANFWINADSAQMMIASAKAEIFAAAGC